MTAAASVAVIGATGYAGYELARLLLRHPHTRPPVFYLRDTGGARCIAEVFPALRGWGEAPCRPFSLAAVTQSGADFVFLATPHEASLEHVPALLGAGQRVVDLSGAFRFRDAETLQRWYQLPAPDEGARGQAVYGLPELYADSLAEARLVANPGCYATAVILGLRPLVEAGWIARSRGIVCDCKSGTSGAGKEPKRETHFCEVNENFCAYNLFAHRHTPEVLEHLELNPGDVIFSTHLLPVTRGLLATLYVWLEKPHTAVEIETLFRTFYAGRRMVRVWPAGQLPELQHVAHTNFCDIGFALDESGERLMVVSCLDNLGKGAAGQAVQNFNLMLGIEEATALA